MAFHRIVVLAAAALVALPALARAQDIEIFAPSRGTIDANAPAGGAAKSEPPAGTTDATAPDIDDETLARILTFDPVKLTQKRAGVFGQGEKPRTVWSKTTPGADGVSMYQVKTPITSSEWNAAIGGELAVPGTPAAQNEFDRPLPGTTKDPRAGAAWANVEVPDVATVEARVAPSAEERKASASLQREVPLGSSVSVMLENRVSVTEPNTGTGPSVLPSIGGQHIWGNERQAKLNLKATGTTLAASAMDATDPNLTNRTFSADQKIYGPLHVTTSVTNPGQPNVSKSIGAGLKFSW